MIKVLELFSGYGGASFALSKAGVEHKCVGYSDIEKCANYIFALNHGEAISALDDVTKINPEELEDFDLLTGGFPCSPAGTLIKTKKGYKEIENITTYDYVLTHNNRFEKVKVLMSRESNHINIIKGVGVYDLKLTDEHPVYTYNGNFIWKEVKDLKKGDFLVFNINQESKNPLNLTENECWLLGRYCADGSFSNCERQRLYFSIGKKKRTEFEKKINTYSYYVCHEDRNCQEFYVDDIRLYYLCSLFGNGSKNKEIPQEIIDLPIYLLEKFLEGYISGDGYVEIVKRQRKMFSTVSEKMLLGLQECFIKTENRVCSITRRIDNRSKTFNDSFNAQICKNNRDTFIVDNKILVKIKNIKKININIKVYNFEVENDNSYTCNNIIVHNCQSFSIAGKREGFKAERKGQLFFEIIRIAEVKKPRWMLLENVQGLLSHDKGNTFNVVLNELKCIGYYVHWKLLFSKEHGTPQNRPRVWFACFRDKEDYDKFMFPEKEELKITVKDLLEDEVDEKYYLSEQQKELLLKLNSESFINNLNSEGVQNWRYDKGIFELSDNKICATLTSTDNDRRLVSVDVRKRNDGVSPTLASSQKGGQGLSGCPIVCDDGASEKFRTYKEDGLSPKLKSSRSNYALKEQNKQWRRLTPKECFRLQGFFNDEIEFGDLKDNKLYFLAGNGWDINVASKIFIQMFKGNKNKQNILWNFN